MRQNEVNGTSGIEYIVPILGGLGREGVMAELPALLQVTNAPFAEWCSLHPLATCAELFAYAFFFWMCTAVDSSR